MNNHKVILYNLGADTDRGSQLHSILNQLNIPAEEITSSDLNQRVGYMAGISGYFKDQLMYMGSAPDCQFMLMCNLEESLLDSFLEAMMAAKLRINYKAVVTEHNADYTLIQLLEDIIREHDMYQSYVKLNKLIKEITGLDPFVYGSDAEWGNMQTGLNLAKKIISRDDLNKAQLDNVYNSLSRQYKTLLDKHLGPKN